MSTPNPTSSREVQIRQLLLIEHRAEHEPAQALKNVKAKIGQCDLTLETVKFWFKRFDKGDTSLLKAQLSPYYMPQIVPNDKYLMSDNCKFRSVTDPLMSKKVVSNDGRIGLIIGFKKLRHTKLFAIDLLNGDSREIYKAGVLAGIKEESVKNHLVLIDEEHLLVFNDNKRQLSLLKFDSDSFEFKLRSQVTVGKEFEAKQDPQLYLDELDRRKFILGTSMWNPNYLAGSVVEDTIVIDRRFSLQNSDFGCIRKYVGNQFFDFYPQSGNSRLFEWNLETSAHPLATVIPSTFNTGESIDFNYAQVLDHFWHEDWIYIAVEFPVKLTKVYALNLKKFGWFDTKIVVMGSSTGMFVDEDKVLVMKVCEDEAQGINSFYRFPLKKPESLMNLAWFTISRCSTVFGNKLFDKFADRLPYTCELRSFLPDKEEE